MMNIVNVPTIMLKDNLKYKLYNIIMEKIYNNIDKIIDKKETIDYFYPENNKFTKYIMDKFDLDLEQAISFILYSAIILNSHLFEDI